LNFSPGSAADGLAIEAGCTANVLAHELGHAAGLKDIYYKNGNKEIPVDALVKKTWLKEDWNNGPPPAYYDLSLRQADLVKRLLMHGYSYGNNIDIPAGKVYGVYIKSYDHNHQAVYDLGQVAVGLYNDLEIMRRKAAA